MSAKLKISIEIEDENGNKSIKSIASEKEIPSIDDFMKGENFRENFDILERAILKARKEISEEAVESYIEEASKKKSLQEKKEVK